MGPLFPLRTLGAGQALSDTRNAGLYCSLLNSSTHYHVGVDSLQTWKDGNSHLNEQNLGWMDQRGY